MYWKRCLLISALFIAPLLYAQSSTSQDPTQQNPTNTNQPPQNPLSQQPTSDIQQQQADLQKQQQQQTNNSFDVSGATGAGEDVTLGEIRIIQRYTEVNGLVTQSFRIDPHTISDQCGTPPVAGCIVGAFYQQYEFNFFTDKDISHFWAHHRFQLLSQYRGTSDVSVDPERNSLQKGYMRIFSPKDEIIVGDALINYSRLTFNQNIKGLSVSDRFAPKWKISFVGGVYIDRWGSLYKQFNSLPGRPFMATVFGGRLEHNILRSSTIGLNFSSFVDQTGTYPAINPATGLPFQPGDAPEPTNNQVVSMDGKFNFKNGLRLDGEYAYSFTDFDRRYANMCVGPDGVTPCDTNRPEPDLNRKQGDWAGRLEGSYRFHKLSLRAAFVRYEPNFASQNARQIPDLQDWLFRASYDLTRWLTLDGTARRSNNDLRHQLSNPTDGTTPGYETILWGPEMKFIIHDLAIYKRASLEIGFRDRYTTTTTGAINTNVRIPYSELILPVKRTFLTLGYERRQVDDHVNQTLTSNTDRFYGGVRGIFDVGRWLINPSVRYELERQSNRPAICTVPALPAPQFCTDFIDADSTLLHNSNRLASASLYIEAPKYFIFEGQFRSASSTLTSLALPVPIIVPPTNLFSHTPSGYDRPTYKAQLTYKINNDENYQFNFSFERNINFYAVILGQPNSQNYDERIWQGGILIRFGRKKK